MFVNILVRQAMFKFGARNRRPADLFHYSGRIDHEVTIAAIFAAQFANSALKPPTEPATQAGGLVYPASRRYAINMNGL